MFETFTVIPSIDLKGGQVVRLLKGDMARSTVYGSDPAATAREFEAQGARMIHVVDLDGAVAGEPKNLDGIRAIRAGVGCEIDVSGGLRTIGAIRDAMTAGADRVALGSIAFLNPELLSDACSEFRERVFGSIDARDGKLAIKGWVETSALTVADAAARFRRAGVAAIIYTDISRDGTERGSDVERFAALARHTGLPVIASGGVASLDDLRALKAHFGDGVAGAISGRALYEGRFTLAEALAAVR